MGWIDDIFDAIGSTATSSGTAIEGASGGSLLPDTTTGVAATSEGAILPARSGVGIEAGAGLGLCPAPAPPGRAAAGRRGRPG